MDPLSITASIIAVLTFVTSVVKTGKALRDAPNELQAFLNSLADAQLVVNNIDSFLKANYDAYSNTDADAFLAVQLKLEEARGLVLELQRLVELESAHKKRRPSAPSARISWIKSRNQVNTLCAHLNQVRQDLYRTFGLTLSTCIHLDLKNVTLGFTGIQQSQSLLLDRLRSLEEGVNRVHLHQQNIVSPNTPITQERSTISSVISQNTSNYSFPGDELNPFFTQDNYPNKTQSNLDCRPVTIQAQYNYLLHHEQSCSCACHSEHRKYFQGFLGLLFIGYKGLPALAKKCTNRSCQHQSSIGVTVTYYFPHWFFWQKMVSFGYQTMSMSGSLQIRLRFPNIVSPSASVFYFARFGTPEQLRFLFDNNLASPFDIHANTGATPLHWAQADNNASTFQYLLSQGADLDVKDHFGWSASLLLLHGTFSGRISEGSSMRQICTITSSDERLQECQLTDLHKAIVGISRSTLDHEIGKIKMSNATIDDTDGIGATPLYWAATRGDRKATKMLLTHGADPNHTNSRGRAPLHQAAAMARSYHCASLLVRHGADIKLLESQGRTALSLACTNKNDVNSEIASFLLRYINPATPDKTGKTAFIHAAVHDKPSALKVLAEYGVNLDVQDNSGYTALAWGIFYNHSNVVKVLLELSVDHTLLNEHKGSILHIAARHSDATMRKILMEANLKGLDIHAVDDKGQTAREVFLSRGSVQSLVTVMQEVDYFLASFCPPIQL